MSFSNTPLRPGGTHRTTSQRRHGSTSDGGSQSYGLGLSDSSSAPVITTDHDYDIAKGISDSPFKSLDTGRTDSMAAESMLSPASATFSSAGGLSPAGSILSTPFTPDAGIDSDSSAGFSSFPTPRQQHQQQQQPPRNPFNFTPVQYNADRPRGETMGKRKGHKYRHSSIHAAAMDSIIQAPSLRTPLSIPAYLPMPTRKEAWRSMTANQTSRLTWCLCHFLVAGYVQFSGEGSLAMTALSRLLLFDAAGATACVAVDVMGNFEVWRRSSIKHPFGLERADVLLGFGMAVFIAFMGLDVISHGIEHALENVGAHEPHTSHVHDRVAARSINLASALAIGSTLISAILLKNHARIGKATSVGLLARGGRVLGNPSHVLTLSCSLLLLVLPYFPTTDLYTFFDLGLSFIIATFMIAFGVRLGASLASMLLMSYKPGPTHRKNVRDVLEEISSDPGVSGVEEARFWQVHYDLCMANLKLRCRPGSSKASNGAVTDGDGDLNGEVLARMRHRIASLIRQRLGGKWEISMQMALDPD